jgi:5-methylthioadenosine/S-adenosylhomocysteine deaminase
MCRICETNKLTGPCGFVWDAEAAAATGGASIALPEGLPGNVGPAAALALASLPRGVGEAGRRTLIKGGVVLSMDDSIGNFTRGDVLIEGDKIVEVAASIDAPAATVIEAAGRIVLPGFIDTHHHQFETALRSQLAHAILINDGRPENARNYYETMLLNISQHFRPEDVYVNELFGGIAQIDAGVTTVMDVSQIHHSPEHSDAAVEGLRDAGRRAVFGYFEGWGDKTQYPKDAGRLKSQYFAGDGLLSMVMGGEIYIDGYEEAWKIGRELGLPIALHVVGTFGMAPTFEELAKAGQFGPDNIFIHMTGMTDTAWKIAADAGAHVSLAVPIEMHMRHGTPPLQKALDLGMTVSLSSDVECTMSADMFTLMRGAITLQRMEANADALAGNENHSKLMQCADALRHATIEGARGLKLDHKTGSLTPGKEADIVLLDAEAINVAPLNNAAGAVVTLMDRSNVETVICAGRIRKWKGQLLGHDVGRLRAELEKSRDHVLAASGIEKDLFAI